MSRILLRRIIERISALIPNSAELAVASVEAKSPESMAGVYQPESEASSAIN